MSDVKETDWINAAAAQLMASIFAVASLASCCHTEQLAAVSDGTVVAAGTGGAAVLTRPKPVDGAPLASSLTPGMGCIPGDRLLALLGPVCSHETETKAGATGASGDLAGGKPPPTRQVSWYCDQRLVVRVVWEPCDSNKDGKIDSISPLEVSVATHPAKN